MLEIGLVTVRGPEFHPNRRLMQAAGERGCKMRMMHPQRVWCSLGVEGPRLGGPDGGGRLHAALPRLGATISEYSLTLLRHLEAMGIRVFNRAGAVNLARHKYLAHQALAMAGIAGPDTCFVPRMGMIDAAAEEVGGPPVVVKLACGRQGSSVALAKDRKELHTAASLLLRRRRGLILQRYIPPQGRLDYRVLVIGGRARAALAIRPRPGEFRANIHLGGRAEACGADGEIGALAERAAAALGLDIAGVDLAACGPGEAVVMEVNCSPGFRGLEKAAGIDAAGLMVGHIIEALGA